MNALVQSRSDFVLIVSNFAGAWLRRGCAALLTTVLWAATAQAQSTTWEAESMSPVGSGATVSTTTDTNASGGKIVFLNASGTSQSLMLTSPSIAAGLYQVQFHYRRRRHSVHHRRRHAD